MDIENKLFMLVDNSHSTKMVILTDYKFWHNKEQELDSWLSQFSEEQVYRKGSVIMFPDNKILLLFLLRWQ